MKLLTIIAIWDFSTLFNSYDGEEIDFNPKLLQKELNTLLCGEDFQMHEMSVTRLYR